MSIKTKGTNKLIRNLTKLSNKAENLSGENTYSFDTIFSEDFMSKYTNFDSISEFLKSSPEAISNAEEFDKADETILDAFVSEQTIFSTWEEMMGKAGEDLIIRQLGL